MLDLIWLQTVCRSHNKIAVSRQRVRYFGKNAINTAIQLSAGYAADDLPLKAPITTAADDKLCNIFPSFQQKVGMIFHENCLPADDSHEISCLICNF